MYWDAAMAASPNTDVTPSSSMIAGKGTTIVHSRPFTSEVIADRDDRRMLASTTKTV